MQRVSALLPSWDRRRSGSRGSLDKVFGWDKSVLGLHRLSTQSTPPAPPSNGKVGREVFWPAALDRECDRAARILKSFCSDGYMAPEDDAPPSHTAVSAATKNVMKQIPPRIIQNAAGIAIFTCMRSGLWMTGSGGSGILIARKADGTWSPPSGILLHTPTLSFIIGVDIYDCVLVLNDLAAVETLIRPSVTLGEDVGLTAGPLVALGSAEVDGRWKELGNTVLTYLKARGQAQNVNLNGCILTERANENERFYSGNVSVLDILAGNVQRNVEETRPVFEVIKAAEGRSDYDAAVIDKLSSQCAPGDAMIETPTSTTASPSSPRAAFGIPTAGDPDPFGVLALEMAGLEIREAGTRLRPTSNQFEYNPSPSSPLAPRFQRASVDTYPPPRSHRGSYASGRTVKTSLSDAGTQTDAAGTPVTSPSPSHSEDGRNRASFDRFSVSREPDEIDYTKIDLTPLRKISGSGSLDGTTVRGGNESGDERAADLVAVGDELAKLPQAQPEVPQDEDGDADDEDDEDDEEEPVVYEVASAVQPVRTAVVASHVVQAKGALVTIPKRVAPPLPIRSPARNSRSSRSDIGDVALPASPLRQSFSETECHEGAAVPELAQVVEAVEVSAVTPIAVPETFDVPAAFKQDVVPETAFEAPAVFTQDAAPEPATTSSHLPTDESPFAYSTSAVGVAY